MPRSRKRPPSPTNNDRTAEDVERIVLPSDVLREIDGPDTFRVWHCPSDPHQVGEFVVTISPEGVRIWESFAWHPSKTNATSDHDAGDDDAHDGYLLSWHELTEIGGRAIEIMNDLERDTREIIHELEMWTHIRNAEAHRILRAKEIERTQNTRRILHDAGKVLDAWMPPARRRVTWRDMVRRAKS